MYIFDKMIFMNKICTKCKIEKPIKEFYKDSQKKSGYRPDCKVCNTKITMAYAKNNREAANFSNRKYKTGVSKEKYLDILVKQNYKCAICGKNEADNNKKLSIDHCHNTKLIRGLLCTNCNFALGYFKDSKENLERAIEYLNQNLSYENIIYKK